MVLLVVPIIAGCSNRDLDKQEYYERGMKFLDNGNPNGAIIAFKKAIERDQNYFEARYQLALAYILKGKYESAEKELNKVLRLNPSFNEAYLSLAKVYINTGKAEEGIKKIEYYLQKDNNNPEAYELLAVAYSVKKDYKKAEELLKKALDISPGRAESKLILAGIYTDSDRDKEAEALVREVIKTDEQNKKALYLLARIQHKQNKIDDLIATYQKILDVYPDEIRAQLELGMAYLWDKDFEKAKKLAESLVNSYPKRPEGYYLRGLIYFHENKIDEAIISFQKSIKRASIPGAYYYLGLSHLLKGHLEQATSEFYRVINIRPEMIQARLLLAVTHLKNKRLVEAEKETLKALDIDEKNAFAHNLLGSIYLALGKNDQAMREFDRAIELDPTLVDAHIKKGAFNLLSGDKEKAEEEFVNAVKIAPELLNSRIILAQYYIRSKDYENAIKTLKDGIKENPNDAILYNMIGAAYLGMKDVTKATQYFEKAKISNPEFFLPYFNLALLYWNQGDKERAIEEYQKVLDIDSDNISALLMIAKILETEKRDEEALSYYLKAKEQGKVVAYISLARYYYRKNETEEALKVLDEALRLDPENIQTLDMKGRIYLAHRRYDDAFSVYRNLKDISPEIGAERLATVFTMMDDYDMAIKELKEVLVKRTNKIGVLIKLVDVNVRKKDYREAERYAHEIVSLMPEDELGYRILGNIYISERQFKKAFEALKKAKKLNPDSLETRIALGKAYVATRDFQQALRIFRDVEKSNPGYAPAYFLQASTLEMMGKKEKAIKKYKRTLELFPSNVFSLNNLAYLYAEGYGPVEEAVKLAKKAKELAPRNGSITDTLGWVLYKSGNYDEAIKAFIEATYYLPEEPTVRYHLGLAYLKKGMNARAAEQLKNAIRLGRVTPFPEIDDAQKLLESINRK
jgi:putative PEP-CTERM system TPR-repeat lipoprotein